MEFHRLTSIDLNERNREKIGQRFNKTHQRHGISSVDWDRPKREEKGEG